MPDCIAQEYLIDSPAGSLEVVLSCPKHPTYPMPYVVICHPHPLFGGTMNNKVVYTLASLFNQLGAGSVRFNFRGVGKSTGKFDNGNGELDDLRAVVAWLNSEYAPQELWLAGFSFGSYIALRAHELLQATRLVLIAPPMERFDFSELYLSKTPTIVVQGAKDEVVSADAVYQWVSAQMNMPNFIWMPEAGHFFHGQLNELRELIKAAWTADDSNLHV